jgi:hypothetical protein
MVETLAPSDPARAPRVRRACGARRHSWRLERDRCCGVNA